MESNFHIADLPAEKVSEINEFQRKLNQETNRSIVLVAYEDDKTTKI